MVFLGLGILYLGKHLPGQDGLCPNLDVLFGSYGFSVTYGAVWRITNALIKRTQFYAINNNTHAQGIPVRAPICFFNALFFS